ncbi:MAG: hypothetical protein PHN37_03280 [Candidatus Pacebacteria bacterium]|nr:hypothetical protein [Candidatus Paceibacterota bacterium]
MISLILKQYKKLDRKKLIREYSVYAITLIFIILGVFFFNSISYILALVVLSLFQYCIFINRIPFNYFWWFSIFLFLIMVFFPKFETQNHAAFYLFVMLIVMSIAKYRDLYKP